MLYNRVVDDAILIKEVNSSRDADALKANLYMIVPELKDYDEAVYQNYSKINLYKKEYKILIKKDGIIRDITECSDILNREITKEKYVFGVDLFLLRRLLEQNLVSKEKIEDIIARVQTVLSGQINQERKYIIGGEYPKEDFKNIRDNFNLGLANFIRYDDTYYEDKDVLLRQLGIKVRKRVNELGEVIWTIKRPI